MHTFPYLWRLLLLALQLAESDDVAIYFGVGCFWHVQHSFIEAEQKLLNRSGTKLTAIAGYAGASADGLFCYKDGKVHAEVIELVIPESSVGDIAGSYFRMFRGMDRSHSNDKGPDYRAAIGLPGGVHSSFMTVLESAMKNSTNVNFELREGTGDDPDTLKQALIWIYDTNTFPFQQAEMYHQFHDDYLPGGKYPMTYHNVRDLLLCTGRLKKRDCEGTSSYYKPYPQVRCHEAFSKCKSWNAGDPNCHGTVMPSDAVVYSPDDHSADDQDQSAQESQEPNAENGNAGGRNKYGGSGGGSGAWLSDGAKSSRTTTTKATSNTPVLGGGSGASSARTLTSYCTWLFVAVSVLRLM